MKHTQTVRGRRLRVYSQNRKLLADCALMLSLGYILSGASLLGQALPLAACLVAASTLGVPTVAATLGAMLGYIARCEAPEAVEFTALALLMLGTQVIFQGTGLPSARWFMPVLCAFVCAVLGSVRLIGTIEVTLSLWCSKWLLAGLCTDAFARALRRKQQTTVFLAAAVVAGLGGYDRYVDLGFLLALMLSSTSTELMPSIVFGLVLDMSGSYAPCATLALALPALVCHLLKGSGRWMRLVSYLTFPIAVLLFFDALQPARLFAVVMGVIGSFFLQRFQLLPRTVVVNEPDGAAGRLEEAAEILDMLCSELPTEKLRVCEAEAEQVFDAAAERVCRRCPRFSRCWQSRVGETYREISLASKRIMERGLAYADDFTEEFRENCCYLEGFLNAVNRELEGMLFRRRYRIQLSESCQVISQEYDCVAQYLRAARQECQTQREQRYLPRVSICCAEKQKGKANGDKGVCFSGANANYYVLLCDGMGTGEAAARLSTKTVHLLERLLKRGLEPLAALKLLNGSMLLRGSSAFSTVDLLHLDLYTGEAMLYKWGAAPSFWRDNDKVKKLGTAAPPPGVGVGGDFLPEQYKLSLKTGELLVLISDGAYCEETETAISSYRDVSAQELAALLIAQMEADDDMTAIVVSLRPRIS